MSDLVQDINQPEQDSIASSVGAILAAAREAAGLSIEQAAAQLRLSVRQIHALEADDALVLPAPTFVRGFIRNYAKLLQLDADGLLEAYRAHAPVSTQGQISLHSENIPIVGRDKKTWLPYILASIVVGLSLAGWMMYMEYQVSDRGATEPVKQPVAVTAAATAQTIPAAPQAEALPVEVAPPPAETIQAQPEVPQVASTGLARLGFSFKEQCWVSVTDREGKELFNKTIPAGRDEVVEGLPPLKVVVGNASGVQVSFNDKPVDLAPHTGSNVARLTLE